MKKLLLVGDGNSIHLKSLAREYKESSSELRVDLLHTHACQPSNKYVDSIYFGSFMSFWQCKIKKFSAIIWIIHVFLWSMFRKNKVEYDSIQIHFVSPIHRFVIPLYKRQCQNLVSVIWGSDLFRCKNKKALRKILLNSDVINCSTSEIENSVKDVCGKNQLSAKIAKCKFGLSNLSTIKKIKDGVIEIDKDSEFYKYISSIKKGKTIVTVGYNGSQGQQHIKIINSVKKVSGFENCVFIFPMTYGGSKNYISDVVAKLEESKLEYHVITNYLSAEELSLLRIETDILIQLQTTDALSGSMQEHLYSGNHIITGDWLPYNELKRANIRFETVSNVAEIGKKLSLDLELLGRHKEINVVNSDIIWGISSFESVINEWKSL